MKKGLVRFTALAAFAASVSVGPAVTAQDQKPTMAAPCKQCHTPQDGTLFGPLGKVFEEIGTVQMQIGPATWLVRYDEATKIKGADSIYRIKPNHEIQIVYAERGGHLYAETIKVKPPAKVPEEKLMKVDELARLVEMGPEKGNFTLVDSRPEARYNEGHIPGAISIYDAEFDKHIDRLPKEKDRLLVFYCLGVY